MVRIAGIGSASALLLSLFLIGGGAAISADAAPKKPGVATFGDKPTFQSDSNFVYDLSADKEAFTFTFNPAFEIGAGNNVGDPPVNTRAFSVAIPVNGGNVNTTFIVTAFVAASEGASGALVLAVNDKQTVTRFQTTRDGKEFLVKLSYRARSPREIRLSVLLVAERNSTDPKATALVNVTSIDTDLAFARRQAAEKGKKKK